jgi:hypothetical protein
MLAAAGARGEIHPVRAWMLVGAVVVGALLVAARIGDVIQLRPAIIPKPPDALVERARAILTAAGHTFAAWDSEHWFTAELEPAPSGESANARLRGIRFTFRQSPSNLVPQNLFRLVTADDPSPTVPGMASVNLDADGRLIDLIITPGIEDGDAALPDWNALFTAAGYSPSAFRAVTPERPLAVPHDQQFAWRGRSDLPAPFEVNAATLRGRPVYFGIARSETAPSLRAQGPLSPGGTLVVEATLWLAIVLAFVAGGVMARHNYRRGEGDRHGARRLSVFVVVVGTTSAALRGHHVPNGIDEVSFLLGIAAWALLWGAFSWLIYMSLEPHARRLWPAISISWQRVLFGRFLDPMVGRDLLFGLVAGVALTLARLPIGDPAANDLLIQQLTALHSTRAFIFTLLVMVLNAVQNSLAGLLFLLLVRAIVRRTWIAALIVAVLFLPFISGGTAFQSWAAGVYPLAIAIAHITILMRVGLLSAIASLYCQFLLIQFPLTLDTSAWYFGYSIVTLLIIVAMAVYGALVASASGVPPHRLRHSMAATTPA